MTPAVSFVRIYGNGNNENVDVIIIGVVSQEFKKQHERDLKILDRERSMNKMLKTQRNEERANKLKVLNATQYETFGHKVKESIAFIIGCFLCWGMELGLVEYIGGEGK